MTKPLRLRLSRKAGFNLQALSQAVNGLPAVNCTRMGPYGNPFKIGAPYMPWLAVALGYRGDKPGQRAAAIALHVGWLTSSLVKPGPLAKTHEMGVFEYSNGARLSVDQAARGLAGQFAGMMARKERFDLPDPPSLAPLRGKNLGCTCKLCEPCHCDTLLVLANAPEALAA